ncbi:hypothetical protein BDE02_06G232800 [Populus trichocarpa]|nr:hypothetical protein BDE02_06G232800 [Populus trichocarpa]
MIVFFVSGEYLALTGDKLNGVEMIACGLASHYALHERLDLVEERLGKLITDEATVIETSLAQYGDLDLVEERLGKLITDEATVIETSLAQYGDLVYPDKTSKLYKFETFDKCFSHDTVEEIVDALENEKASTYDEWCERAISKIKEAAPLSLKVTLQSIREGRFQSLDQCLAHEYCIFLTGISKRVSNDFCEWDPSRLGEVSKDMVDSYFSRLGELEDLELPTTLQGMLDANDWGHLQTGMMRVLEDTGDLLPFSFALLSCSISAAGAGI